MQRIGFLSLIILVFSATLSAGEAQSMLAVVPIAFYTPETGFAGGGALVMITNVQPEEPLAKPNQLNIIAYYTQKHQYVLDANSERYYNSNALRVFASGNYRRFPDRFWGVGKHTADDAGEDYAQIEVSLFGNPMWRVFRYGRLGPSYHFSYFKVTDTEEEGLLRGGTVTGSECARISGFGAEISWDLRGNIFYPLHGTFAQLRYVVYHPLLGSQQEFSQGELDIRQYLLTFREHVLALQCKATVSGGEIPFQMMSKLGGSTVMRGMYDGRFRDKHSFIFQAEYRIPLFWRFGVALFGSGGQVFSCAEEFSWKDFRIAIGAGGRFSIMEEQRVNCRLDVGFCEGEMAIYFKYQEAF